MSVSIKSLSELVDLVAEIGACSKNLLVFRGEKRDYGKAALVPYIYRDDYIVSEEKIYRESQKFNDEEFYVDKTAFDKLSRIQHYSAPTRLIDVSEDLFSAVYFAIAEKELKVSEGKADDAIIYLFEIDRDKIRYYDSDTVSVISNLAKIPLYSSSNDKSKEQLLADALKFKVKEFNEQPSAKFLRHEVREEKPHFEAIIDPEHLTSIQFVYPKFTSNRVRTQRGAFLLFGLNVEDASKPIKLIDEKGDLIKAKKLVDYPVKVIHKFVLKYDYIDKMQKELKSLGIRTPFIYPEIDKVSEYLVKEYKREK